MQGEAPGRWLKTTHACSRIQTTEVHEHELTNPRIASRKHHFRTDNLSAVAALGDTTRGVCCWLPDATLAERARLGDICWPEYLAMEALPHCAVMKVVAPALQSDLGYLE
jgi:hypothetical protein